MVERQIFNKYQVLFYVLFISDINITTFSGQLQADFWLAEVS